MNTRISPWPVLLAISLTVLLFAGCAGDGSRCVALPGGGRYCLQATTEVQPFDTQQMVDIVFGGKRETMVAQLEVDASGMRFVGATPFGQTLLQLGFDNREVSATSSPRHGPDPALLLALVQLVAWPADSVRAGLGDAAELVDTAGQRLVLVNDKLIATITYTRGLPPFADMRIQLPAAALEFSIVNLDVSNTP